MRDIIMVVIGIWIGMTFHLEAKTGFNIAAEYARGVLDSVQEKSE